MMRVKVPPRGPENARIMLVGEAPGANEEKHLTPFIGASGQELDKMLHEAGILRSEVFITNVCKYRPPKNQIDEWLCKQKTRGLARGYLPRYGLYMSPEIIEGLTELQQEISRIKPNVIIAAGGTALWALTGESAITSWRGSLLQSLSEFGNRKVIPVYHPAAVLRMWSWRFVTVHDLRRAERESHNPFHALPKQDFVVRPKNEDVAIFLTALFNRLEQQPTRIAVDIETRCGHIACIGFAVSATAAICIPFMCVEDESGYWGEREEADLIMILKMILEHPNAQIIGQNFLYDAQYIVKHWGIWPHVYMDTMIAHHACWPGTPKGLDYLSSLYCANHVYWKGEGKDWNPAIPEEQLWRYNCKDCVVTFEVAEVLERTIDSREVREAYTAQMDLFEPVLEMMLRGVRINAKLKDRMGVELLEAARPIEEDLQELIGEHVGVAKPTKNTAPWYRSPKQTAALFYDELGMPEQHNRKTGRPTTDDEALAKLPKIDALAYPLTSRISTLRSIGVFFSTFVSASADTDGRMRTSYNITGTETFRFSSSENAFGSGMNLQNIPAGDETGGLPNVRELFIPDPGYIMLDCDLDRADLQVVVWEADDAELKAMLREGADIHSENAKTIGFDRAMAKRFVHGTNYGGSARTMAITCGITIHQAERAQQRWFGAHPGIKHWHTRVEAELACTREVTNRFGYRRFYFDRIAGLLPEALAWVPQSTVANVTNRGIVNLSRNLPEAQVLMQVHDSIVLQVPRAYYPQILPAVREQLLIEIPYDDPLIIPVGVKASDRSWGDVKEVEWEQEGIIRNNPRVI